MDKNEAKISRIVSVGNSKPGNKTGNIYNCTPHIIKIPDIVRAEGIYVYDSSEKKYMDLESGVWCMSLGHTNKRINNIIKNQIKKIMHIGFCYETKITDYVAEKVLDISGIEGGKCVFLCSGSEVIELARQIARKVTGLQISMTLHDSYLGSYSSVVDRAKDWYIFDWSQCDNCEYRSDCRFECEKLKKIPSNISEFILEPGSSSGFVRFPPVSLIRNIVNIVRNNGGRIISNEVTTGIGRTGKWFGFEHYGITPDMIAIGKGVGNGYPVSITVLNEKTVFEASESGFKYMQSHQNDPLGAIIAGEVISIISDEDLISGAETKGRLFLNMLKELEDRKIFTDVRGRGLMFGIDICDKNTGDTIYEKLLEKGYIICNRGGLFRIDPPLTIEVDEFRGFVNDLKRIVEKLN